MAHEKVATSVIGFRACSVPEVPLTETRNMLVLLATAALAADFNIEMSPLVPGSDFTITVTDAPANEVVDLFRTDGTLGHGTCQTNSTTTCMDITPGDSGYLHTARLRTDANGAATLTFPLPSVLPVGDWAFQGVAARSLEVSEPVERTVCDAAYFHSYNGPDADVPDDPFVPDLTQPGAIGVDFFSGGQGQAFAWGARPGDRVTLYVSNGGTETACPPELGGVCLDLVGDVWSFDLFEADGCGVAMSYIDVPATWTNEVTLQAVWTDDDGVHTSPMLYAPIVDDDAP
jgi:hypothetical protein